MFRNVLKILGLNVGDFLEEPLLMSILLSIANILQFILHLPPLKV